MEGGAGGSDALQLVSQRFLLQGEEWEVPTECAQSDDDELLRHQVRLEEELTRVKDALRASQQQLALQVSGPHAVIPAPHAACAEALAEVAPSRTPTSRERRRSLQSQLPSVWEEQLEEPSEKAAAAMPVAPVDSPGSFFTTRAVVLDEHIKTGPLVYTEDGSDESDTHFMHFDALLDTIEFTPSNDASSPAAQPREPSPSSDAPRKARVGYDSDGEVEL